ncbi:uncharacterized protein LOC111331806 [Stylophora pistillata]|uniref:uncharacterized protein LOC111331806 n=1 Tax=Stylophora pistillata TaxID=50429 RepID=UPI000C0393C3|nr:uncharacterized protein LOC111331806 [Stylophora pistillata]
MALISVFIDESILTNGTKTKEACYDTSFDETCGVLNGTHRTVRDVDWKAHDPKNDKWTSFGYCNGQLKCEIKRSLLPNGIKVLKVANATITLQVSSKTNKDGQSRLRCRVDLEGHTSSPHEVIIKFVYCIMPTTPSILRTINSSPGSSYSGAGKSSSESFDGYPTTSIVGSPSKNATGSSTQCIVRIIVTTFHAILVPVTLIW